MKFKANILILLACLSIAILFLTNYTGQIAAQVIGRGDKSKVNKTLSDMAQSNMYVKVIQSSKAGDRLTSKANLTFVNDDNSKLPVIKINSKKVYQKIVGFGGAFTPASAHVLNQITPEKRREVLDAYFGPNGSNYTLMRTMIGSCYGEQISYDDAAGDASLNHFTIRFDSINGLLSLIKDAMSVSKVKLNIFGSPCSPPAWMKTNGSMLGNLNGVKGYFKNEYSKVYAQYFSKYIKAYELVGIPVWGVTIQNEPQAATPWEAMLFPANQELDFVKNYLGPRFSMDGISAKIIIFDHNKDNVVTYCDSIYKDETALKYIWGSGVHWYSNSGDMFGNLTTLHNQYPTKHILFTEGCIYPGPQAHSWGAGETYGHRIIGDLNNWTEGWVDWNIVLNQIGGPLQLGNKYLSAPILADTITSALIFNPSYYYIAHFSKYIMPGAYRIDFSSNHPDLQTTAFKNPDNSIVVVVMNQTSSDIDFKIKNEDGKIIKAAIPAHSIIDFMYNQNSRPLK